MATGPALLLMGGVYLKEKGPALICCQDLGINQKEQNTASSDVALINVNLFL